MMVSSAADVAGIASYSADVDPGLIAIIQATEAGQPGPQLINILVGTWLVQGRPVSSKSYVDTTRDSLFNSVWNSPDGRRFRGSDAEKREAVLDVIQPAVGVIEQSAAAPATVLHMVDVMVAASSGPSLHPPVFRVKASSVDAWWINDFEVKQPKGGGSIGVGFSF
ncbi:hypothetical protein [Pseudonocardia sp. McavD-2-B]|uniref:hypothetical protein n=1 Tax=Pseudonocardia sp. McavD-2-B TaxID=2954499 RepID=UPI0020975207|nr:hypothetical protein [Pseudonocardia sp. McavD-2-B]MCO7196703.1 hypothetical protein [Pseudonocardia sp. McavD-2-B]